MKEFIFSCGVFFWPILVVAGAVGLQTVRLLRRFRRRDALPAVDLIGLPFWGVVALVLGVLGQFSGMYRALLAIGAATEISPAVVAMGLAESFTTTLLGLMVLLVSLLIWGALVVATGPRRQPTAGGSA